MKNELSDGLDVAQRTEALLGEGPAWDSDRHLLLWVDVTNRLVHQWNPATGEREGLAIDPFPTALAPWKPGHLALAGAMGFGDLDLAAGSVHVLAGVDGVEPRSHLNDARCDAAGRYWGGTIAYYPSPGAGKLYRLDPDGSLHVVLEGLTISNGLGWSPDNRVMYLVDSFAALDAFDFDLERGRIARRRPLVQVSASEGVMDGMTVDEEGYLWVAMFGGGSVRRYAPDGRLVSEITLPVTHPTSCVFGGTTLADLYITSARQDQHGPMDEARLAKQPLAGSVFHLRPGVAGMRTHAYGAGVTP